MECNPREKMHRFPMGHRKCYCGSVVVPKAKDDSVGENTYLFRASTIVRRAAEKQAERLAEEEARMAADNIPFNADLPEAKSGQRHVPGAVTFDTNKFLERYLLDKEQVESKDREMLRGFGLRGEELEKALGD